MLSKRAAVPFNNKSHSFKTTFEQKYFTFSLMLRSTESAETFDSAWEAEVTSRVVAVLVVVVEQRVLVVVVVVV